jgi:hypothetical protein
MTDLIYLAIIIGFFLLALAYIVACDALTKGGNDK